MANDALGPRAPIAADQEDYPLPCTGGLSVPSAPGRLVEAYDVLKPVGKGGYAIVFKGIRREDGRVIAVKKVEVSTGMGYYFPMSCNIAIMEYSHATDKPDFNLALQVNRILIVHL